MKEISGPTPSVWDRLRERLNTLKHSSESGRAREESLAVRLASRAKALRGRMETSDDTRRRQLILGFSKGRQRYGVPVADVEEIHPLDHYTPVPKAPQFIRGVVHCRGTILSLIDLGMLFEAQAAGLADTHFYLVIGAAGRRIAVAAGDVEDIVMVREDEIKPTPEIAARIEPDWIIGVHDNNRLVLRMGALLQSERLVSWKTG